jgi:2'-5' RNA ligase
MPRVRLASALLVPEPFATEIDGLRRALGESLERVPPHITLVPPVNVRVEDLGAVFALLRSSSAAATESFTVTVGPAVTFHPVNPVVYLAVTGDGVDELRALRERVCTGPFGRPLTYDFVPHVTVVEHTTPDRIEAAMVALADYRVDVTFESAFVLQQREHGHIWDPIADARFELPGVVGRGGIETEITVSTLADPEVLEFLGPDIELPAADACAVARREGRVVAVALATGGEFVHFAGDRDLERHLLEAARRD